MKRDTRTPTFWTSEPVRALPAGQGSLPFGEARREPELSLADLVKFERALAESRRARGEVIPAECRDRAYGFMLPCVRPMNHDGPHADGIGGSWGGS